ncbi:hypothetical protein PVAND_003785 [Polypedilum vanderplanki]|uniref:Uncharacterized protein n=1 Tax=Polypedilum vanderplanki TaxID=319348 RepID=A0A9J6BW70_POLVA|nr:hypothetical protein PVAND_003785 [Polypedilum vanderplanki]
MKTLIFWLLLIIDCYCRQIYFEELNYWPKEKSKVIDYGSMRLTRSRDKKFFYFKGSFTLLNSLANEKLVILELHKKDAIILRTIKPFCEFIRTETEFWPKLSRNSNMPKNNPCPFPSGRYTVQKFSIKFSRKLVEPLNNGKYTMTIIMQQAGNDLLKYMIVFSIKN